MSLTFSQKMDRSLAQIEDSTVKTAVKNAFTTFETSLQTALNIGVVPSRVKISFDDELVEMADRIGTELIEVAATTTTTTTAAPTTTTTTAAPTTTT